MSDIAALVADNLDLWTGAIKRKNGAGRGGGSKRITRYGIERLRALILDLAVRGKLVPQDAAEESATELLKRIDAAKPKLVEAGYIARSKARVDRSSPEAPFSIPVTWTWVRLERLGAIVSGGTPPSTDQACFTQSGAGIPWLTPADLSGYSARYVERGQRDLTERGLGSSSAKVMPQGTVLFTSRAPIGYVAIAANLITTNQGFKSVVPAIDGMSEYIATVLKAFAEEINENAPGTTFKEVSGKLVSAIAFPLPPLAEQRRIVAKVDELMALCGALERESADALAAHQTLVETLLATLVDSADAADLAANWARVESHFDTLFTTEISIDALKQTILDLAVRGKLVAQDPSEGTGAELLASIQTARRASGRRDWVAKPGAKATMLLDNREHLPASWTVARLGQITSLITDGTHSTPTYRPEGVAFISVKDIDGRTVSFADCKFIDEEEHRQINSRCDPRRDDILLCRIGTLGRPTIVDTDRSFSLFVSVGLLKFVEKGYYPRYQHLALSSPTLARQFDAIKAGGSHTNKLNLGDIPRLEIPLPPLAEQHRIVAKVDELMNLCDALKARLAAAAKSQRQLADAIVERAAA